MNFAYLNKEHSIIGQPISIKKVTDCSTKVNLCLIGFVVSNYLFLIDIKFICM
ncbi:hypothetical protein P20429_3021 [Pseudoalteromonas sp. BSi20429]|nr:hypothetical protein P20429_3021 [Pseudoalteromonas sp. BSi20429]